MNELTKCRQERAYKTAEALLGAFTWDRTPQGHEYWSKVQDELLSLVDEDNLKEFKVKK